MLRFEHQTMKGQKISLATEDELSHLYVQLLEELHHSLPPGWYVHKRPAGNLIWQYFHWTRKQLPPQGWKIHFSIAAIEAPLLLQRIIPLLINRFVSFKFPTAVEGIVAINFAEGGETQIGKIVTIYPSTTAEAAAIARELDQHYPYSRGPKVSSDVHLRAGGAVSLRYGAFGGGTVVTDPIGRPAFTLEAPDGSLTVDRRELGGAPPDWVPALPIPYIVSSPSEIIEEIAVEGDRFLPLALISSTPISKVFLGLTTTSCETVVLKKVQPGVAGDLRGFDARNKLINEYSALVHVSQNGSLCPKPIGLVDGDSVILIEEDIDGIPFHQLSKLEQVCHLPALARAIAELHTLGYAHRDLKLSNVLLTQSSVRLIDFGLAAPIGAEGIPTGGTRGYIPPEGTLGPVTTAGDLYALGVCIAHTLLEYEPASLPSTGGRLIGFLQHTGNSKGAWIVQRLVTADPQGRLSAEQAAVYLSNNSENLLGRESTGKVSIANHHWCLRAAWEAGLMTRRFIQQTQTGAWWRNTHFLTDFQCEGINLGAAGIVLGLSTIDQVLGRSFFNQDIESGAEWLASREPTIGSHGLFTGNAGVALALALAAQRLGRKELIKPTYSRLVASTSNSTELDLFCGAAGVVLAGCLIARILEDDWAIQVVHQQAQMLLEQAENLRGVTVWAPSKSLDSATAPYTGAAHGSAGIALALSVWGKCTSNRRASMLAVDTFKGLYKYARTSDFSTLLVWLSDDPAPAPITGWCHGVIGYLWCLLQSSEGSRMAEEIDWAVSTLSKATTAIADPTYCHGLSGQLETWRMLCAIPRYQTIARHQADKLASSLRLLHQRIEGQSVWCSDDPRVITPDLWIGFLAPATALALHAINYHSTLLSEDWLRICARQRYERNPL